MHGHKIISHNGVNGVISGIGSFYFFRCFYRVHPCSILTGRIESGRTVGVNPLLKFNTFDWTVRLRIKTGYSTFSASLRVQYTPAIECYKQSSCIISRKAARMRRSFCRR